MALSEVSAPAPAPTAPAERSLVALLVTPWFLTAVAVGLVLTAAAYLTLYIEFESRGILGNQHSQYALTAAGDIVMAGVLLAALVTTGSRGARRWETALLALAVVGWLLGAAAAWGNVSAVSLTRAFAPSTFDHVTAAGGNAALAAAYALAAAAAVTAGSVRTHLVGRVAASVGLLVLAGGSVVASVTDAGRTYGTSVHQQYVTAASLAIAGALFFLARGTAPRSARWTAAVALVVVGGGWWAIGRGVATVSVGRVAMGAEIVGAGYLVLAGAAAHLLLAVQSRSAPRAAAGGPSPTS